MNNSCRKYKRNESFMSVFSLIKTQENFAADILQKIGNKPKDNSTNE